MANTDQQTNLLSESNSKEEVKVSVAHAEGRAGPSSATASEEVNKDSETPSTTSSSVASKASTSPTSTSTSTAETRPANAPTRPTLVQLGSSSTQPSSTAPHPHKKFNAVNINKKFLEKNSAAAMATASSASTAGKSIHSMSRPQIQTTQSHSRLVTAKLTGSPAPSSTTGPGWSRPTSTAPSSTGTSSPIGSSPLPAAAVAVSINSGAPQLPHVGKVIQPQPRAAVLQTTNLQKEGVKSSVKPAWANVRPPVVGSIMTSEDFPTAAEVAKATASRKPKQDDQKMAPESAPSAKHRLEEEADTFRGVHLDPNAHHWDEMEEDNDDFLGGVIEFGDGRQYKVEATEPSTSPSPYDDRVSKEDRFVDDFDRSWPKSKPSPTSSTREFTAASPALSSRGTSLHGQDHSQPQLFNERSNRLEPYSYSSRTSQSTYQNRRGSHNDGSVSPAESRRGGVQLLQKSGNGELPPRPRGANGASSRGGFGPGFIGDRRDTGPRRDYPPSPRTTRNDWGHHEMAPSTSLQGRDREPPERGRRSDMGPPPVPLHAERRPSQESGRQLPPHLSPNMPLPRRLPSRDHDSRFPIPQGATPTSPASSRFAPPSPSLSHTSTLALSPGAASNVALPGADLNEVTKDLMQSAAARAKARKQQEEAEREAQKERARRKAAELEEKMKGEVEKLKEEERARKEEEEAKAKERDKEVAAFLEDAVSGFGGSAPPLSGRRPSIDAGSSPKNLTLPRRPASQRGQQRRIPAESGAVPGARRPSFSLGTRAAIPEISPASQSESWRAKANPLPPPSPARQTHSRPPHSAPDPTQAPTTLPIPSTALDQVADIVGGSMTDLEVVDFTNMGKFVGDEESKGEVVVAVEAEEAETEVKQEATSPRVRPTASDFFEDSKATGPSKGDNVWRRKTSVNVTGEGEERSRVVSVTKDEAAARVSGSMPATSPPSHNVPHPRLRPHTEASMSALDDVMSRIRGAIDGMQASGSANKENRLPAGSSETEYPPPRHPQPPATAAKASSHRERWQAPTRPRPEEKFEELREPIGTSTDPSYTPPSADLTVQLPEVSHRIEPIPRRQQIGFSKMPYPARFELLSFEPPVQGMNKRDFSVNSVLFRQPPPSYKGARFRVALPRSKSGPVMVRTASIGPRYNSAGAFGKATNADGAMSWRKALPTKVEDKDGEREGAGEGDKDSVGARDQELRASEEKQQETHVKARQPKMPAGSVVAFIRDSRIDAVEADPKPLVNFIVTSELDEPGSEPFPAFSRPSETEKPSSQARNESQTGLGSSNNAPLLDGVKADADPSTVQSSPSLVNFKASESKSEDDSTSRSISAPSPSHQSTATSTPWGRASLSLPIKDGTVRAPDPEHLKAVWSQPANKSDLNPVNSLEGIADDLTSVPFSIQDVKSEDGETPPPALPSTTSRMSLHEVTKAFQKVPSSSSSSSTPSRNPISPSSTNGTPATRSPYPYSPMPSNTMRPPHSYEHYSPMLTHSPSPTIIYPHQLTSSPVPSRMTVNGHTPMYQAPMWIHQPPASAPGNPGNVMRPMMSPYTPMMPYPAPGTPVYAHPMSAILGAPPQPPVGTAPGRGRGVPMMSPGMPHAHAHATPPMYASSPVMMHMQPVPPHQNHAAAYMGVHPPPGSTPGRGQPRTDMSHASQPQAANATSQQPHHPPTYNPTSFIRSTW